MLHEYNVYFRVNFVYEEGLLGTAYVRSHVKLTALMLYLPDDGSLTIRVTLAQSLLTFRFLPSRIGLKLTRCAREREREHLQYRP